MRAAYHVQSHRAPAQVLRLVARIRHDSPNSLVLVSHQASAPALDRGALDGLGGVVLLPAPGGYGDFSHIDRWLESVRWLVDHDERFDWLLNVSGQDYPVIHLAEAERVLAESTADAWVETFPVFGAGSHWSTERATTRYGYSYRRLGRVTSRRQRLSRPLGAVNRFQPWLRFSAAYQAVGVRTRMPLPAAALHGGSFFANLDRRAVLAVLEFTERNPTVVNWARRVLAPEETYLQTVLHGLDGITVHNDCRRYFDFSSSAANHPRTLTSADLAAVLSSDAWFARKFDVTVDAGVLDALDRAAAG